MQVWLNGKSVRVHSGAKAEDIAPTCEVFVRNGYGIATESLLNDGDSIIAIKKGEIPSEQMLQILLSARNGEFVSNSLKKACVCVCGLGGLGSNIAQMLARLGVGKLILVDFDIVDPTNLNRQNYFICDIGIKKTQATARIIKNINPYIEVITKDIFVSEQNAVQVVEDAQVVVEAFDTPSCKAEIVSSLLNSTKKIVVASSGMAGFGSSNEITTKRPLSRLYVCGDGKTEAKEGVSLMSPRVNICAGHQANMVLRILLGEVEC